MRRSAGQPCALTALFEAEPDSCCQRGLMAAGMRELLGVACGVSAGGDSQAGAAAGPATVAASCGTAEGGDDPWPRVHAFNCLRMAFQHSSLAVDSSAFVAPGAPLADSLLNSCCRLLFFPLPFPPFLHRHFSFPFPPLLPPSLSSHAVPTWTSFLSLAGMETCILGLAAAQWEVRNSATLCYTALVVRVLGFRNTYGAQVGSQSLVGARRRLVWAATVLVGQLLVLAAKVWGQPVSMDQPPV